MQAFELSRAFDYKWTVSWKCVPSRVFSDPAFASALLALHVALLLLLAHARWCAPEGGLHRLLLGRRRDAPAAPRGGEADDAPTAAARARAPLVLLLSCNFIGVACARTLHYQFYTWYFHAIPALLWHARLPTPLRLVLWLGIETAFNVYPATWASSTMLQLCHAALLIGLWRAPPDDVAPPPAKAKRK